MNNRFAVGLIVVGMLFIVAVESKNVDPYKVLGVDKSATQREIQKAFHKLSLQYHPDKNKKKGAEAKFAEINNAYDILSDEQKRKNYDLYGDEKGDPGLDAGNPGDHGGYTHFTSGGPGQSGWQNMGGQGSSKSFSFSFGGSGKENSFGGFDLNDMFSSFFGGGMGGGESQSGGFGGFGGSKQGKSKSSTQSLQLVNAKLFRKEIADKGVTWLLFFHTSNVQGIQSYESVMGEVANSLQGALKAGSINCQSDASLCKELGVHIRRSPKIFVYSYASSESGSLLEYAGDLEAKSLKSFCQDNLPRFSRRINLENFNGPSRNEKLPVVLLLSTKKNTPVIWRALSGLYRKRILFYDAQVEASDSYVKKLGADSLPSIIGWFSNGEKELLKSGISVKDLKSAIQELSGLMDTFEKRNKKVKRDQTEPGDLNKIQLLTSSNFHEICAENVPVCFIAAFKSSKTKDKLQAILQSVSQKSFLRQPSWASGARDSVSYALLDSAKQQSFLKALDKSGFKSLENLLVAYKSKRGTYAVLQGEITEETLERFISSVLNGDVQFSKTRQKPTLK